MTDTTDNLTLTATIEAPSFQQRVFLRFVNAAIAVTTEVLQLNVNATTASGNATLHFASAPSVNVNGYTVTDLTTPAAIPANTTILSGGNTTSPVMNQNAVSPGVGAADLLMFSPPSHTQRLTFAGSLFAENVPLNMLASAIVANATIRAEVLANPGIAGGNALDSDIDFQVNSIFTGLATSRTWT